jgi:hypothetical protein
MQRMSLGEAQKKEVDETSKLVSSGVSRRHKPSLLNTDFYVAAKYLLDGTAADHGRGGYIKDILEQKPLLPRHRTLRYETLRRLDHDGVALASQQHDTKLAMGDVTGTTNQHLPTPSSLEVGGVQRMILPTGWDTIQIKVITDL